MKPFENQLVVTARSSPFFGLFSSFFHLWTSPQNTPCILKEFVFGIRLKV